MENTNPWLEERRQPKRKNKEAGANNDRAINPR